MPTLREKDGQDVLELNKSETRRILEAVAIAGRAAKWLGEDPDLKEFVTRGKFISRKFGGQHLNEDGSLKLSERDQQLES